MDYPVSERFANEKNRIEPMMRRFMVPMIPAGARVLSVGCGLGSDVLALRSLGIDAWGVDPARLNFDNLPEDARAYFRVGSIENKPFGEEEFDFIYALDVIEHVGCLNFGKTVTPETEAIRLEFIKTCIGALSPGGKFIMTTSNKRCPVDVGHWHNYHWLGKLLKGRRNFGISIPWSRKNFLVSIGDVKRLVERAAHGDASVYEVSCIPAALYPGIAGKRDFGSRLVAAVLHILDKRPFCGSFLSPVLVVAITRGEMA